MIITSDGRKFAWAVFGADGYECEDLAKLFEHEKDADAFLGRVKAEAETHGIEGRQWQSHPEISGDPKFASKRMIEIEPIGLSG